MKWLICVDNTDYQASLEFRKLYEKVEDAEAESLGLVRVIDESGESYLYAKEIFAALDVSKTLATQLLSVSSA